MSYRFTLPRLPGGGLVKDIYAPDLAFDIADVEALLRQTVARDPPGLSRYVWERTGGWATAVHAAVEMVRAVRTDQRLDAVARLSHPGQQQLLRDLATFGGYPAHMVCATDATNTARAELSRQGLVRRSSGGSAGASVARLLRARGGTVSG